MSHKVKCYYCGQIFDRDKEPFQNVSNRRYAHKQCYENHLKNMEEEEQYKIYLNDYIKQLFSIEKISTKIQSQINKYIKEYNYTYSGILKTLEYYYGIQNGTIEKSNGGIGIVPYVYEEAKAYYYNLWLKQNSAKKNIANYQTKTNTIIINPPVRKIKKKERFSFLDNGGDE